MLRFREALCFLLAFSVAQNVCFYAADELTVILTSGSLFGRLSGDFPLVREFVGIRYGESTAGKNRFQDPQPYNLFSKSTLYDATSDKPSCPQIELGLFTDEDCLFLSVYTPRKERIANRLLPVIFWVYGGAFFTGGAYEHGLYRGSKIVSQMDCVVVTFNYRVGALGYLATSEIEGNFGLKDQLLALKWVQDNIEHFGGNPHQIIGMGESAGALSLLAIISSPKYNSDFYKLILMSPPLGCRFKERDLAVKMGHSFAKKIGCADGNLQCMQQANIEEILTNQPIIPNFFPPFKPVADILVYGPIIDGVLLCEQPSQWAQRDQNLQLPLIIGHTTDEMWLFYSIGKIFGNIIPDFPELFFSEFSYKQIMRFIFKEKTQQVFQYYTPSHSPQENINNFLRMCTDYVFKYCISAFLMAYNTHKSSPAWLYEWQYVQEYMNFYDCSSKSCHATDLPIIFGMLPTIFTPESNTAFLEESATSKRSLDIAAFIERQLKFVCPSNVQSFCKSIPSLRKDPAAAIYCKFCSSINWLFDGDCAFGNIKFSANDTWMHQKFVQILRGFVCENKITIWNAPDRAVEWPPSPSGNKIKLLLFKVQSEVSDLDTSKDPLFTLWNDIGFYEH